MQIPPSSVLALWPSPNYRNPITHGPAIIVVLPFLLALVFIFLCIRFYTRVFITRGFGADDILILLAFVRLALSRWTPPADAGIAPRDDLRSPRSRRQC